MRKIVHLISVRMGVNTIMVSLMSMMGSSRNSVGKMDAKKFTKVIIVDCMIVINPYSSQDLCSVHTGSEDQ